MFKFRSNLLVGIFILGHREERTEQELIYNYLTRARMRYHSIRIAIKISLPLKMRKNQLVFSPNLFI